MAGDGTIELSAEDAEPLIGAGWLKLGELIDGEPPEDEKTAERNKPKANYAVGSLEWEAAAKKELAAREAAEEEKERRRLARVAAFLENKV